MTSANNGQELLARKNARTVEAEVSAVKTALARMAGTGEAVTFYSVARESGVSRQTLYRNPQLRALVESARESQPDAAERIRQLEAEVDRLKGELALMREGVAVPRAGRRVRYSYCLIELAA